LSKILPDNSREHTLALYLDTSNTPIGYSVAGTGSANECTVDSRGILQRALAIGAVGLVFAHNHTSGNVTPSQADWKVHRGLSNASDAVGLKLLDSVVIGNGDGYSMSQGCHFNY
jgi:DNA repair protein RadC